MIKEILPPPLTIDEFKTGAMQRLLDVFIFPCSFESPFSEKIVSKEVIFCELCPNSELLEVIGNVASSLGDEGFFFSFIEFNNGEILYPGLSNNERYLKTWFITFKKIQAYCDLTFLTGQILYSPQGKWGIYVDYDDFLLIGGNLAFMNGIKQGIPNLAELTHKFIEDWKLKRLKLNARLEWIPRLLEHLYGIEETEQLLYEHGLYDLL